MRHGLSIYFFLDQDAEMLDWRGFCVTAECFIFFSASAGGLTENCVVAEVAAQEKLAWAES
jgi:hypothetical protein